MVFNPYLVRKSGLRRSWRHRPTRRNYLPLVTRVFTFSGRPIYGVPVTFTSEDPTAIISAPTVITNYEGYALTSVTAPGNAASFSVTALTGTRGSPQTGFGLQTGGGIPTDTLTIRGGQGQVVQEQFQLREPMVVQVRDAQGRPAVGRTITFAIRTGSGTFNTTTGDGTVLTGVACVANVCTARTDIDGRAAVGFIATSTASGSSFLQQTISATDGLRTVLFTVTTLLGQTLGGAAASPPLVQRLAPTGNLITGTVGTTVLDAIRVRVVVVSGPQAGQGIPNVSLGAFTISREQSPATSSSAPSVASPAWASSTSS